MTCIRTLKDRTTAALGTNGKYTSKMFPTELYNQVRGIAVADVNGSVELHESYDGVTFYKTKTESVTGGTPLAFAFVCHAYFARVVYTNGAGAQTTFDLQVYADPFA